MKKRFAGLLPVIIDVETAGFNAETDALLEIAATTIRQTLTGKWEPETSIFHHVQPFEGANLDPKALAFLNMDPFHPFRFATPELEVLRDIYKQIREKVKSYGCKRAVLVGHNAWFDLAFLKAANDRCDIHNMPFHRATCFDTATLSGIVLGETVLAKAMKVAKIDFNPDEAHSALYDAEKTAELFCYILNEGMTAHLFPHPKT